MQISTNYSINPIRKNGLINGANKTNANKRETHPVKGEFSSLNSPNFGTSIVKVVDFEAKLKDYRAFAQKLSIEGLKNQLDKFSKELLELDNNYKNKKYLIATQPWWHFKRKAPQYNQAMENYLKERTIVMEQKAIAAEMYETEYKKTHNVQSQLDRDIEQYKQTTIANAKTHKNSENAKNKHFDRYGFDSLAGYEKEKMVLERYVLNPIKQEQMGVAVAVPGSILFFGPQGNGKSTFAEAFAEESNTEVTEAKIKPNLPHKIKEQVFLKTLLEKAEKAKGHFEATNQRTVIIVDELDEVTGQNSVINKELSEFLETCSDKYHCTVFATTNYPENIGLNLKEDNMLFPVRVGIDPPNVENKARIIEFYTKGRIPEKIDCQTLAQKIEEREKEIRAVYSNAYLEELLLEATTPNEIWARAQLIIPNISEQELLKYQEQVELLSNGKIVF